MQLVIADTGPVNYLILIGQIDLLPLPISAHNSSGYCPGRAQRYGAPATVRAWIGSPPVWLEIMETHGLGPAELDPVRLDEGEAAVIALAISLHADMVLIDEREGAKVARNRGLRVTGTLGLLEFAAQAGLVDFTEAAERRRRTTFRSPEALLESMLKKQWRDDGNV